jgi:hypothetical protein
MRPAHQRHDRSNEGTQPQSGSRYSQGQWDDTKRDQRTPMSTRCCEGFNAQFAKPPLQDRDLHRPLLQQLKDRGINPALLSANP